jgi:HNH endonuclease
MLRRMAQRKLTHEIAAEIRARWAGGNVTQRDLAATYGVRAGTIWAILRQKTFKDPAAMAFARRRRVMNSEMTLEDIKARCVVDQATGCWIWQGARSDKGYGQAGVKGRVIRIHRLAYLASRGRIPKGAHILHRCDNPPCANPAHVFAGTNHANVADRVRKGRSSHQPRPYETYDRGEDNPSAKLTWAVVRAARECYARGGVSMLSIAKDFGIARETTRAFLTGRTWKESPA